MTGELLTLTTYFGERDRSGGDLVADALIRIYEAERVRLSALVRGAEGFGRHHSAHTDLLLTLSEDLPVVSVAVDSPERIEALIPGVLRIKRRGLVTLERSRLVGVPGGSELAAHRPDDLGEQAKLTVFLGRGDRTEGGPAHRAVCRLLRRVGVAGTTVLLGVDGTHDGARSRARLVGRNSDVPVLVVAVGSGASIAAAAAELDHLLGGPLMTLERIQLWRRDGARIADPEPLAPVLSHDAVWAQKLTVHSSEDDRVGGHPLHRVLVRRLRGERVAGVTTLRGIWGFHRDEPPHGDRLWQARRHCPVMTIVVDSHVRIAEVFALVEVTAERGLVTVEAVPVRVTPGV